MDTISSTKNSNSITFLKKKVEHTINSLIKYLEIEQKDDECNISAQKDIKELLSAVISFKKGKKEYTYSFKENDDRIDAMYTRRETKARIKRRRDDKTYEAMGQ